MEKTERVFLSENIIQFRDTYGNACSLIVGDEKAVLFDTMLGLSNLKEEVCATLKEMNSPLNPEDIVVINSHFHMDHIGGNFEFSEVYVSPDEKELVESSLQVLPELEAHIQVEEELVGVKKALHDFDLCKPVIEGDVFSIGSANNPVTLEVISLPGHTKGSIGLLYKEKKLLFLGDACTPMMCLFMNGAQDLSVYEKTVQKLLDLRDRFEGFILGHYMKIFPAHILEKFYECITLPGKKKGLPFRYSLIPSYTGKVYLLEARNKEIDETICIILKE